VNELGILGDNRLSEISGVTRVGVTGGATDGVAPIFPLKTGDLSFLVIATR